MKISYRYVDPVDQDLKCKSCFKPAYNPFLYNDGSIECGECRKKMTPNQIDGSSNSVPNYLKKQLNNLLVICDNCDDETPVKYLELENHTCKFKCKNQGCSENFENQKELEFHINKICKKQQIIINNNNNSNLKNDNYFKSFCNFFKIPTSDKTSINSESTNKSQNTSLPPPKSQLYFNYKGKSIFQYSKDNEDEDIPEDIESIAIGPGLKKPFYNFCCKLPINIKELFILEGYEYELESGDMPAEITTLHLYRIKNSLRCNSIGNGVTSLHLEDGFAQYIYPGEGVYPPNLDSLYLYNTIYPFYSKCGDFEYSIPNLYFKDGYSHIIRNESMAKCRSVTFGNIKQPILKSIYNTNEREITFEDGFTHKQRKDFYKN